MENNDHSDSRTHAKTSIQKQIIDKTVARLADNTLFTPEVLSLLNSESLSEPWCNPEQLERIVNPAKAN